MNKENIKNIINKLNINSLKKHDILSDINTKDNIILSDNWNNFFNNIIKIYKDNKFLYINLIKIINNSLSNEYNIEWYLNENIWIMKINQFIKNIYIHLQNIKLENKKSYMIILDNILEQIFINLNTKKLNITNKNIWCIIISSNDVEYFKNNHRLFDDIYINKLPENWKYIKFENNNDPTNSELYAYLSDENNNKLLKKNLITYPKYLEDLHIKSSYNEIIINFINKLQKIQYKIDITLFINLFENIKNLEQFYYKKKNSIIIKNYDEYILDNINSYLTNYYNTKDKIIKKLGNLNYNENEDNNNLNLDLDHNEKIILKFIYNYDNQLLANNLYMDYRGRLYTLGPISYISSKLFRFLIDLDENLTINKDNIYYKYYIACQLSNPSSLEEGINIYNSINKLNNIDNIRYKKLECLDGKTICLDATSSMLQIIGLLTKSSKILKYTNLTSSNMKYDIYNYIMDIIISNNDYKIIFKDYFTSRKIYKYCIMLYIYGSTPLFSAKSYIKLNNIKNIHIKDLTYIFNKIIKTFKNEFKSITILKKIINIYAELIKYETYYKFNTLLKKLEYSCPEPEKIRLKYKNKYIYFYIEKNQLSYNKKMKSSFVNIIHSLDSEVAILTRINLLEKYNIKSLSIHDCFIIHINNYEKCLECYNESLSKILDLNINNIINNIYNNTDFIKTWKEKYYNYIENNNIFLLNISKKCKIDITNLNDIRKNQKNINIIKNYIDKFITNNYKNYILNSKLLKKMEDFDKNSFEIKNIKFSLKPE